MPASGPAALPAVYTADDLQTLAAANHPELHADDRDELRALWSFLGTGRVTSAAIQAVIDAGVKIIRLPEGLISITGTITLAPGVSIIGSGPGATILDVTGNNFPVFQYEPATLTYSDIRISDLSIQANSTVAQGITGIKLRLTSGDVFENLMFRGIYQPFYIDRGRGHTLKTIKLRTHNMNPAGGCWFGSTDLTAPGYLFNLSISDFQTYGPSDPDTGDGIADYPSVIDLSRVAASTISGFQFNVPQKIGIRLLGDCQGVDIANGLMVGLTTGIVLDEENAATPIFTVINGVAFDQATAQCILLTKSSDVRIIGCDFTISNQAIIIGPYTGVARTNIIGCTFWEMTSNAIVAQANASVFSILGNRFLSIGNGGSGVPIAISGGTTNGILVAHNDMRELNTHGTISDASAGTERFYLDNLGAAPAISNPAGTIVRHASQVQTDSHIRAKEIAVGSPPANPPSGYGNIWVGDDDKVYKNTGTTNVALRDAATALVNADISASAAIAATKLAAVPRARVRRSTDQTITNVTFTAISFDVETGDCFDTDSMWAVGQPTRITFTTAGTYILGALVSWAADSDGHRDLVIRLNGTGHIAYVQAGTLAAPDVNRQQIVTSYHFAAGDYVELLAFHSAGNDLAVQAVGTMSPVFWATRASA